MAAYSGNAAVIATFYIFYLLEYLVPKNFRSKNRRPLMDGPRRVEGLTFR